MNSTSRREIPPIIGQFFREANEHVARIAKKWTNGRIELSTEPPVEAPIEDIVNCDTWGNEPVVAVGVLMSDGTQEYCGQIIQFFGEQEAHRLANALMGRVGSESSAVGELEKSALLETANILSSAYLNRLGGILDQELRPSVPFLVHDYAPSILQQALLPQLMESDTALSSRSAFEFDSEVVRWDVFLLPSNYFLQSLERAGFSKVFGEAGGQPAW